jgi:cytidine deaminase
MKKSITLHFTEYEKQDQLPSDWSQLLDCAKNATNNSFAPYSQYLVGWSLELENGEIVLGYNQETVAFPSGLCAERVALFKYGTEYGSRISRMAVTARSPLHLTQHPITSCGGCLQVMIEFEKRQNKYNLQQFKLINQNKIRFVQQENTRKQKIKLKKQLLCPISTI